MVKEKQKEVKYKDKFREARYKLMKAIKTGDANPVDCVKVRVAKLDKYLQEVATNKVHMDSLQQELNILKMNNKELESYKLICYEGTLFHYDPSNPNNSKKIASTLGIKSKGIENTQAFVLAKDGSLYTATHLNMQPDLKTGIVLTHGSFLGGRPVELAGMISINEEGKIDKINNHSGHYMPDKLDLYRGIMKLKKNMPNIFTEKCIVGVMDDRWKNIHYTDMNKFLFEMEQIGPNGIPLHQELREQRIKDIQEQIRSLKSSGNLFNHIDNIIPEKPEPIEYKKVKILFLDAFKEKNNIIINYLMDRFKKTDRLQDLLKIDNDYYKQNLLFIAIDRGDIDLVESLIDNGANPNKYSGYSEETSLSKAITNNDPGMVDALINGGAYLNEVNYIHNAVNNLEIINSLLAYSLEANQLDENGDTALHSAALRGSPEVVKALIEAGIDINALNKQGQTALFCCTANLELEQNYHKIIELLYKDANLEDLSELNDQQVKKLSSLIVKCDDDKIKDIMLVALKSENALVDGNKIDSKIIREIIKIIPEDKILVVVKAVLEKIDTSRQYKLFELLIENSRILDKDNIALKEFKELEQILGNKVDHSSMTYVSRLKISRQSSLSERQQ